MKDQFRKSKEAVAEQRIRVYIAQEEKRFFTPAAPSTSTSSSTPVAPQPKLK